MNRRPSQPSSSPPRRLSSSGIPISPPRLSRPSPQPSLGLPSYSNGHGAPGVLDYDARVYSRVQAWRGQSTAAGAGAGHGAGGGDHHYHYSSSPPDERDSDDSMETIIIPIKDISNLSLASRVRTDSSGSQPVGLSRGRPPLASTTSSGLHRHGSAQLASGLAYPSERRPSSPGPGVNGARVTNPDPLLRGRTAHPLAHGGPFTGAQGITPLPTYPSPEYTNSAASVAMGRRASSPGPSGRANGGLSLGGGHGRAPAQPLSQPLVGRRTVGFDVPGSAQARPRSPSPGAGGIRRPSVTGLQRPSLSNGWDPSASGPRTPTPGNPRPNGLTAPQPPGSLSRSSSGATVTPMSESNRAALDSYARSFHVSIQSPCRRPFRPARLTSRPCDRLAALAARRPAPAVRLARAGPPQRREQEKGGIRRVELEPERAAGRRDQRQRRAEWWEAHARWRVVLVDRAEWRSGLGRFGFPGGGVDGAGRWVTLWGKVWGKQECILSD